MITCLEINTRALGNALFEYATLFGVGKKLGYEVRIPTGNNHTHEPTGQKIWQLKEIFNIQTPDITTEEINDISGKYVEKTKDFDPDIFNISDNTNLIGFYQAERYFKHCKKELKEQLTFGNTWICQAVRRFAELGVNPSNSVSIHIRRGDYTKPHLQPFHPLLSIEYYNKAISYIQNVLPENKNDYTGLVFTDDKKYCQELVRNTKLKVVDNPGEDGNILDLCMMSMCSYHIIANSSFSWWGAYLSDSKCVVYPSQWFGPGYGNFNIVDVEEWIKV